MKTNPRNQQSELLPPDLRAALIACAIWPESTRTARIDALTDEATRRGLARNRADASMEAQWLQQRPARGAA